jgi:hypothetical protein
VLHRTHEQEIIQAEDDRERTAHQEVLHPFAPALNV